MLASIDRQTAGIILVLSFFLAMWGIVAFRHYARRNWENLSPQQRFGQLFRATLIGFCCLLFLLVVFLIARGLANH
jgi:hypothetical protein